MGSVRASSTVLSRETSSTRRISSTQSWGMSSNVARNVFSALYAGSTATTFLSRKGGGAEGYPREKRRRADSTTIARGEWRAVPAGQPPLRSARARTPLFDRDDL